MMRKRSFISATLTASVFCALTTLGSADPVPPSLQPNAAFTLEFPELPPTFYVQKGEGKAPTQMTVRLPANYSAEKKFPLFAFLEGGTGGDAGPNSTGGSSSMMGGSDYICVAMPLFKKAYDPKGHETFPLSDEYAAMFPPNLLQMAKNFPANGLVLPQDYETISAAYAVMLKKLNEVVPNIDASRSALAGFSNGAHTIGVLLGRQDPGILQQFHSFAMLEGGLVFPMAVGNAAQLPEADKNHRYFMMFSDVTTPTDWQAEAPLRSFEYNVLKQFCDKAKANGSDFTFVTTHSGHHFGVEEKPILAAWVRQDLGK
jgi:hypothetical protein